MKKVPEQIDLSILEFLNHGDLTLIAKEDRDANPGVKTHPYYVGKVCKGLHRNDRILKRAIEKAVTRKNQFPQQAIKES